MVFQFFFSLVYEYFNVAIWRRMCCNSVHSLTRILPLNETKKQRNHDNLPEFFTIELTLLVLRPQYINSPPRDKMAAIEIKISLKFVPKGPIENNAALV